MLYLRIAGAERILPAQPGGFPMNGNSTVVLRAIRGPLLLITLGTLFAIDHFGRISFWRTWPVLLIVLRRSEAPGIRRLAARQLGRRWSMRPRSLVGPLILILIGVLFLANNVWPELSIRNSVSLYWPFLLIAWGVLRLGEVLVWVGDFEADAVAGISGGEWFLILLICLIGSGGFWFARHGHSLHVIGPWGPKAIEVFGHPYDFPLSDQKPAGKKPHIVIENLHGDTRVVVGDTDDIKVEGRKTVRAFMQSEADQANKQCPLQLTVNGDQVLAEHLPGTRFGGPPGPHRSGHHGASRS